jgi:hypothetical protein
MATDNRLEELEDATSSLRLAQARLDLLARTTEEKVQAIPQADLRPEVYLDRVAQIRQAAAQRAEEIRSGVAGAAERLKAARGHFTPARIRRQARFAEDPTAHSLATIAASMRLQRASAAGLLTFAEEARDTRNVALSQLVAEEIEARADLPHDVREHVQGVIDSVPLGSVDRAASLIEESDRLLFETAEQARGIATGDRKYSVSDLERIAASEGQAGYVRARASMKRVEEAERPAPADRQPGKPEGTE